jgi:hypothetical protein
MAARACFPVRSHSTWNTVRLIDGTNLYCDRMVSLYSLRALVSCCRMTTCRISYPLIWISQALIAAFNVLRIHSDNVCLLALAAFSMAFKFRST